MKMWEMLQAAYDFWRPNKYGIKPYLCKDGRKHPVAIICPGGAYSMVCSFVEGMPIAKALNKCGYHAVVAYYRTKKKARFPNPHEDLKRAITDTFSHAEDWNLETDGWSLWGSSAGGHLAASFCTQAEDRFKPSALILSYPVITLGEFTHEDSKRNLLGDKPDVSIINRLSVEKQINSTFPPTFVWYGTADNVVDPINSRKLESALKMAGVPYEAEIYEGIGHGVGLAVGTDASKWFEDAVEFWKKQVNRR